MKIKQIETYPLLYKLQMPYGDANGYKGYRASYMFKIITDSGLEGWGEVVDWLPTLDLGFKQRIIPFLTGKNVLKQQEIVTVIKKWDQRIAAGVSMALTEIVAKMANISVCDLWGGSLRTTVPVYASFQSYRDQSEWIESSLRQIEETLDQGFSKIKLKIGGRNEKEDQNHIQKVTELLEGKIGLALDANQSYDFATSRKWIKRLEEYKNPLWFEEPMPLDQIENYKRLRSFSTVPVAGGENLKSSVKFTSFLTQQALDIIQPDVMHMEGLNDFRHTVQLARTFGVRISPHAFDGALSRLYAIFSQACSPAWSKMEGEEIEPVEWDVMESPFNQVIALKVENGTVQVPNGVGIGLEVDEEKLKTWLWDGEVYY